ncbi:MAG: molybdopterin-guanine dinucleotide biosynthesis protein B, partial [Alphaproteobacteria bacterium]
AWIVTVAVDTPFFPRDLLSRLAEAAHDKELACASSAGRLHPVFGLWKAALAQELEQQIENGLRSIRQWVALHDAGIAQWPSEPYDPFFNINNPADTAMTQKVIGVAGFKNAGKTTLVEKLVRELTLRGYRIATVKHAHHSFDIDHEGRDSFRHRQAGASEVAVISGQRWAIIHELRGEDEPSFAAILAKLEPSDLVIVEGYKHGEHQKIEVRNLALDHPKLAGDDPTIVAIAANGAIADAPVPVFDRDHVEALADFIVTLMRLDKR